MGRGLRAQVSSEDFVVILVEIFVHILPSAPRNLFGYSSFSLSIRH